MIGLPFPRYIRCSNIYLPVMFLKIEMQICNVIINNMRIWYWLITPQLICSNNSKCTPFGIQQEDVTEV